MTESDESQTVEQAKAALKDAETALENALFREQRAIEKERQRLDELAHEINTPLNAVIGYAHIMAEEHMEPIGNPEYREHAAIVYQAAVHLKNVCEGILSGSAESGVLPEDLADIDIRHAIDGVIKLFGAMAHERGVHLASEVEAGFPVLRSDPRRLNQVLINLVSNAIKFTPRGGNVTMRAETDADNGAMILVVADDGQGMNPETLRGVMNAFERHESGSPHGDSGSGMGLSIASRVAREIRGELLLASEEGVGTVAAIRLPISYDHPILETTETAVILDGKSVLAIAPYRAIVKKGD